mmetsp:Transcript_510/g.1720  ORF Transcript_510/g.1720 Transcript_510/m.1720 type:complete len:386 (+) Transcript_510:61-1218(+)
MPSPCGRRCLLVVCVAYGLFANHWARDSLGALEVPLESDAPYSLSARRYNALTSLYFLPNIGVPILAGVLAHRFGAAATYAAFFAIAAAGNGLVGASVAAGGGGAFGLLLVGRALMGIAYEAVDVLPIGFVSPRFRDTWTALVGLLNGVNRLGSVTNFLLEPLLYRAGGLPLALSVPSAVGASGLLTALLARGVDASLSRADEAAAQRAEEEPLRTSLRSLPRVFFLFLLGGACVYGAVVPFWFIGAKHLQSRFGMPLATADALLLLPEGMIALVAPPFGLLMDRRRWSLTKRLYWSAASLAPIPVALLLLAWLGPAGGAPALGPNVTTLAAGNSPPPAAPNLLAPALATLVLGTGYAFAQNLIWASLTLVAPPKLLNLCSGAHT